MSTDTDKRFESAAEKDLPPQVADRKFVVALARGLEVLRCFGPKDGFLGNQEIAERTGLAKPTVSRITYTLCRLGYLTRLPRLGKYQLAPTAITLGYSALASLGIRQVARPFMDEVAERLGAPVAMGICDRNRALYIEISRGSAAFTLQLEIGSRIPLATTAMGHALLVAMEASEREATIAKLGPRHGEDWSAIEADLRAAIASYPARGHTAVTGAWRTGIHAVGVPLVAADGSGVYAFNCGGPPHQFTEEFMRDEVAPSLTQLVRSVEMALRGRAP